MSNTNILYEGPTLITLEGNAVFSLIAREPDRAIYQVLGFTGESVIRVIDYRTQGLSAIDTVIETENDSQFSKQFCHSAQTCIEEENDEIVIRLFDLNTDAHPDFMLWITTEIEEPIPDYEYLFFRLRQMTGETFGLVAIFNYQRFRQYFDGLVLQVPAESRS